MIGSIGADNHNIGFSAKLIKGKYSREISEEIKRAANRAVSYSVDFYETTLKADQHNYRFSVTAVNPKKEIELSLQRISDKGVVNKTIPFEEAISGAISKFLIKGPDEIARNTSEVSTALSGYRHKTAITIPSSMTLEQWQKQAESAKKSDWLAGIFTKK